MPEDPNNPTPPTPGSETPPGNTPGSTPGSTPPPAAKSWEEIYSALPDDAKAAHDAHTAGLKSALDKERATASEAAKAKAALEAQQAQAAEAALAEQGKFKELAEQRAAALAAAETAAATAKAEADAVRESLTGYEARLAKILDAEKKKINLPKAVEALLAGKTPAEQLDWLNENAAELSKTVSLPPSPGNGNGTVDVKAILAASKRTF